MGRAKRNPWARSQPNRPKADRLIRRLDPFGRDREMECASEGDGRGDDRRILAAATQAVDERAIDLELIHRETARVAERRVSGPEVVDREANAEAAQRCDDLVGALAFEDQHALGQFEGQVLRSESGCRQCVPDVADEVRVDDLSGRHVHADRYRLRPCRRSQPDAGAAGFAEDEAPELHDQADLLGDRDELARGHDPALRMPPARERLDAADHPGTQVDDRLVGQLDLAARECPPQAGLDLEAGRGAGTHLGIEPRHPGLSIGLRCVQRRVSVALQVLCRELGVVQTRDAGRGPDPHLVGVEVVRLR